MQGVNEMLIVRIGTKEGDLANIIVKSITLEKLQDLVGGYIEPSTPVQLRERGIELLANEEGLLQGLNLNDNLYPFFIVGQVVAVGVSEDDFVGLNAEQQKYLSEWLGALKKEREE